MKLRITFHDPKALWHTYNDLLDKKRVFDKNERLKIIALWKEEHYEVLDKYVSYGEDLTIEVDLQSGTCEIVPTRSTT